MPIIKLPYAIDSAVPQPNINTKMSPYGNIVLVGLSGAGKTTCAQLLSELLNLSLLDTDQIIQSNNKMTVAEIFSKNGEEHFRLLERELIQKLLTEDPPFKNSVLSVGGGLPTYRDNIDLLKKVGFTVFLNASAATLARRLVDDMTRDHSLRPLLAGSGDCKEEKDWEKEGLLRARLEDQLARREKYYRQAHLVIDTDGKSKQDICFEIQTILINHPLPPSAL